MRLRRLIMMRSNDYNVSFNTVGIEHEDYVKVPRDGHFIFQLVGETGKQVLPSTVRVKMGGVDITDTAFRILTNTIEIPSVTGDVVISAEAAVLSSDYEALMYIRSIAANKNWSMNTGVYATHLSSFEFDFICRGGQNTSILFPNGVNPNVSTVPKPAFFWVAKNATGALYGKVAWGNSQYQGSTIKTLPSSKRLTAVFGKDVISYDGWSKTINDGTEFTLTSPLMIFQRSDGDLYGFIGDIFRAKHKEDGTLMHDYIPVKRKSDGYVGLYDVANAQVLRIASPSYILAPFISLTRTLTNCSSTLLSAAITGTVGRAVIGSRWSIKITPSANAAFNSDEASIQLKIGGVDVTDSDNSDNTPYVAYDSTNDVYTITIVGVPQESIELTAVADAGTANVLNTNNEPNNEEEI